MLDFASMFPRSNESQAVSARSPSRERQLPNTRSLLRYDHDEWIELFLNSGCGLLANTAAWADHAAATDNSEVVNAIRKLKPESDKELGELSKLFFSRVCTYRFNREGRTTLTGLQHIGLVLATNCDFARACVARMGGWSSSMEGAKWPGSVNIAKLDEHRGLPGTLGTAWHFCIRVQSEAPPLPVYSTVEAKLQNEIVMSLSVTNKLLNNTRWLVVNKRHFSKNIDSNSIEAVRAKEDIIWLPGDARKQRVFQWLNALIRRKIRRWVIADVSVLSSTANRYSD